jgi:hypothetical protein
MMDGETGGGLIAAKAERSKRGSYRVSARLQRALLLLASGEAASIKDAAAAVGMTREAISKALKKVSVQTFMREQIMASLNISAMKGCKTHGRAFALAKRDGWVSGFKICISGWCGHSAARPPIDDRERPRRWAAHRSPCGRRARGAR